jgi:uncharacterized membrane protein
VNVGDTVEVTPAGLRCIPGLYAGLVCGAQGIVMETIDVKPSGQRCRVRWFDPRTGTGINSLGLDEGWPDHILSVVKSA